MPANVTTQAFGGSDDDEDAMCGLLKMSDSIAREPQVLKSHFQEAFEGRFSIPCTTAYGPSPLGDCHGIVDRQSRPLCLGGIGRASDDSEVAGTLYLDGILVPSTLAPVKAERSVLL